MRGLYVDQARVQLYLDIYEKSKDFATPADVA